MKYHEPHPFYQIDTYVQRHDHATENPDVAVRDCPPCQDPLEYALDALMRKWEHKRASAYAAYENLIADRSGSKTDYRFRLEVANVEHRKAEMARDIATDLYTLLGQHRGLIK